MPKLSLLSPAKINLFLRVLNKRPDGYHNIDTLFERISLFDELTFVATTDEKIRITCNHPQVPAGPKNLVYKAAKLLQERWGVRQGIKIHIKKRIPVAAGLGGGSSNAASALLALNRLWGLKLRPLELLNAARQIGSDVAFFLYDSPWALGTERGDRIQPLKLKACLWHVLVIPRIKIYSGEVYQGLALPHGRQSPCPGAHKLLTNFRDDVTILIRHLKKNQAAEAVLCLRNDLESVILKLCPQLKKIKERLRGLGLEGVLISGSGPCVFALAADQKQAQAIQRELSKRFSQVFAVKTYMLNSRRYRDFPLARPDKP